MKAKLVFSMLLCTGVFFGSGSAFAQSPEPKSVSDNSYMVVVKPSFGRPFRDCFTFLSGGDFSSTGGLTGTWTESALGTLTLWNADTGDGSVNIKWAGIQFSSLVAAKGVSDQLTRFTAVGVESSCAPMVSGTPPNPYHR